jgi:hypothetical protein
MNKLTTYLKNIIIKPVDDISKKNSDYGVTRTKYRCGKCNNVILDSCEGHNIHFSLYGHYPVPGINRITHVKKLFVYKFPFSITRKPFFKWVNVEKHELIK